MNGMLLNRIPRRKSSQRTRIGHHPYELVKNKRATGNVFVRDGSLVELSIIATI